MAGKKRKVSAIIPIVHREMIENRIMLIRGQKVILDVDLASLYGVTTKRLNEQVKRNSGRFPQDFMFQFTTEELRNLKSHFATSSSSWGGRRKLPYAFTKHGAIMAASVLNSPCAIGMSVWVVRAFIKLRQLLATHKELAMKLNALEKKYDTQFKMVFEAIRELMEPLDEETDKKQIGYLSEIKL